MQSVTSKLSPVNSVRAWRYQPGVNEQPPKGIKARTTLHGAECLIQRSDGITFSVMPMDWVVQIDGGEYFPLHDPVFHALFTLD